MYARRRSRFSRTRSIRRRGSAGRRRRSYSTRGRRRGSRIQIGYRF